MVDSLRFIDPLTEEEYNARYLTTDRARALPVGDYKVVLEITQFGLWGSKSYIIIGEKATGEFYWYTLETFDDVKPGPKRRRNLPHP